MTFQKQRMIIVLLFLVSKLNLMTSGDEQQQEPEIDEFMKR